MINLYNLSIAESQKLKKMWILPIMISSSFVIILITTYLNYLDLNTGLLNGTNFMKSWFYENMTIFSFLLPILQSIGASYIVGVEYKSNAFNFLYSLPTKRSYIYLSKVITFIKGSFIVMSIIFVSLFIIGIGFCAVYPDAGFFDFNYTKSIFLLFIHFFFISIVIGTIHISISYCSSNIQLSILIACIMTIISMIINGWKYSYLIPYCWLFSISKKFLTYENNIFFPIEIIWSILYLAIFFILGLTINNTKNR